MLPSKDVQALAKEVVLVVVRKEHPVCAALRREFAVPYLNSWVVVLDPKGETLASWIGDVAGGGCDRDRVDQFPGNLVAVIRRSLGRSETVEELERRWKGDMGDREAFERLAARLAEMHRHGPLRQFCAAAASNPALPEQRRNEFRLRGFVTRASDAGERRSTPASRARFVRDGERLLVELASHPRSADVVDILFSSGYAHAFDVPARSARAIARLRRATRRAADPGALGERIRQLAETRDKWMEQMREALGRADRPFTRNFIAALLGDANAAIQLFSRPPYNEVPEYGEWLREAKAKVEREGGSHDEESR